MWQVVKKRNVTCRKQLIEKVFTSHTPACEKNMDPGKVTVVIFHLALSKKDAMWEITFADLAFSDLL